MSSWRQPLPLDSVSVEVTSTDKVVRLVHLSGHDILAPHSPDQAGDLRAHNTCYNGFLGAVQQLFPSEGEETPVFFGSVRVAKLDRSYDFIIDNETVFRQWMALQHGESDKDQGPTTWKLIMKRLANPEIHHLSSAVEFISTAQTLHALQIATEIDSGIGSSDFDDQLMLPDMDSPETEQAKFDMSTETQQRVLEHDVELAINGELEMDEDELRDLVAKRLSGSLLSRCSRMNLDTSSGSWFAACKLTHHDNRQMSTDAQIAAPGGGRPLLPVQLYSVWLGIKQMEELGSVIHGHEMGMGKSTMYITTSTIYYFQTVMWEHIKEHPSKHTFTEDCPMTEQFRREYQLQCPCSPTSPAHEIHPPLGCTVIITTKSLISVLEREWDLAHPGEIKKKDPTFFRLTAHGDAKIQPTYFDSSSEYATKARALINEDWDVKDRPSFKPRGNINQGRVTIFTTYGSLMGHTRKSSYTLPRVSKWKDVLLLRFAIAFVAFDEFHLFFNSGAGGLGFLSEEPFKDTNPDLRLALGSGTSISKGPDCIQYWITDVLLRGKWKEAWSRHPALKDATPEQLAEHAKTWQTATRTPDSIKKAEKNGTFKTVLKFMQPIIEALILKFSHDTLFFDGEPVLKLVPRFDWTIKGSHKGVWGQRVKQLHDDSSQSYKEIYDVAKEKWEVECEERGEGWARRRPFKPPAKRNGAMAHRYHELQIYSSIPWVSRLTRPNAPGSEDALVGNGYRWTADEWIRLVKDDGPWADDGEYLHSIRDDENADTVLANYKYKDTIWRHIEKIGVASWKLRYLDHLIDVFGSTCLPDGSPSGIVIGSCKPRVADAYLVRVKKIHPREIEWVTKRKAIEIPTRIAEFTYNNNQKPPTERPRFLICTTSSIAMGNTLASTVAIVAMEPNAKLCEMIQYLARPHRLGQMNPQVHCYVMYSEGTIEEKQMERNKSNLQVAALTDAKGMAPVVISSDESDGSD